MPRTTVRAGNSPGVQFSVPNTSSPRGTAKCSAYTAESPRSGLLPVRLMMAYRLATWVLRSRIRKRSSEAGNTEEGLNHFRVS